MAKKEAEPHGYGGTDQLRTLERNSTKEGRRKTKG
jgi:hypothetical protein